MDRRSILAIVICFLILLGYPYFLKLVMPHAPKQAVSSTASATTNTPISTPAPPAAPFGPAKEELLPSQEVPEEQFVVDTNQMRVVLSSRGGSVREFGLKYFSGKTGEMLTLGPGEKKGWKTFELFGIPGLDPEGSYKGNIEGKKVVFENPRNTSLAVRKTYLFAENGYEIDATVELQNKADHEIVFDQGLGIAVGSIYTTENKEALSEVAVAALDGLGNVWRKGAARIKGNASEAGSFQWAGLQNHYYTVILQPKTETQAISFGQDFNNVSKLDGCQAALWLGKFKIPAGQTHQEKFVVYAGPKQYFQLKKLPGQFQKIIDFGMFGPISKGILYLLHYLYGITHNYGIAIILLTVLFKIITYPLTATSFKSMKRMQALQPHINELKEKHKDNAKKLQKEMMELYKEHKVNPMGGCLPMLIQLPIFIALYTALRNAIELKGSSFLWIKDLSLPDTVAVVGGLPINILPVIMGGTMIWQQKLSTVDPQQAKMMMFMPIFFTFIFYSFPSGLVLYWLVNNVLSIVQQYQVQRQKS